MFLSITAVLFHRREKSCPFFGVEKVKRRKRNLSAAEREELMKSWIHAAVGLHVFRRIRIG